MSNEKMSNEAQNPALRKGVVMPRFFFVFVQIGTDEYKIIAEGIDTYDAAIEIRDAFKGKFRNQPFIVASLNEV